MLANRVSETAPHHTYLQSVPAPPKVLREDMPIRAIDTTAVPLLDSLLTDWFYWQRECGGTPRWSCFRPFDHPAVLPHIMLFERIEPSFRCTIVGDEVYRYMWPIKMAGQMIEDAMPAENMADITKRLMFGITTGAPNFVEKTMAWKAGYDMRIYRALHLPFTDEEGRTTRILTAMNFRNEPV